MSQIGPTLETHRLILRPPEAPDVESWAAFATDPVAARFLRCQSPAVRACFGLLAVLVGLLAVGCSAPAISSGTPVALSSPAPSLEPIEWTGPVRAARGAVTEPAPAGDADTRELADAGGDAERGWVDITKVSFSRGGQIHWYVELAESPPLATTLDPTETVVAYGLVLDVNGDSVADYELGISNEAPRAGDFRVWLTNLASGAHDEQVGPPYGYPVEFAHPDEGGRLGSTVVFTFLTSPDGVSSRTVRFYAWASHTEAGEVLAWDYAPDASWLGAPPPRELGCTPFACPELGPAPLPDARQLVVQVLNDSERRALLFVAEDEWLMGDLVGTAEPALIPAGGRENVTFTVPAGSGWAIFVNPTDEESGPTVAAGDVPPDATGPVPFEIVIAGDSASVRSSGDMPEGWFGE